ncbi:MAG TPA: DNA polymerase III subunit gamma/tau [Clostridiales bacterium]|nr:DNA polymerase III subunit gamma/tau [Clostridiales bacterium]
MSYTALYRKFRPNDFDDVKGQEPIITTLKNQIKSNRIGHAYLFCGTRGTGKTSVAKIFAKAVNCKGEQESAPCNECEMCNKLNNNASLNVIEIDAASNNGVDSIRKIVDEVKYSPTEGKYKVYIIDEVHMLSTSAFNALLKTLEEPPPYVIFILATTEVHKIPITVLSRCQRFDFKRITVEVIYNRLMELVSYEGIIADDKALKYIARMADGALRDALSLLDKCISYYLNEKLTYENVLKTLGTVDITIFSTLLRHIKEQDVDMCIQLIDKVESDGRELVQFSLEFIWYLRNVLLAQVSDNIEEMLEFSSEDLQYIKDDSKLFDKEIVMRYIRVFSDISVQIKYAPRKRVILEVGLIKLCRPEMENNLESLINRIQILEEKLEKGNFQTNKNESYESRKIEPELKEKKKKILLEAIPDDLKEVVKHWGRIKLEVGKIDPPLGIALHHAKISIIDKNKLLIISKTDFDYGVVKTKEHVEIIKSVITKQINKSIEITTKFIDIKNNEKDDYPDIEQVVNVPIEYID